MKGEDILFVSYCKGGGQRRSLVGLDHYLSDFLIAEFSMFCISDLHCRCVMNPTDVECERIDAPNAVVGSPLEFIAVGACWGSYPAREPQPASLQSVWPKVRWTKREKRGVVGSY